MMVLELKAEGDACHAAHAAALRANNAARRLAHDLVALEAIDFGPPHPHLGPITLEPTQVQAGTAGKGPATHPPPSPPFGSRSGTGRGANGTIQLGDR